MLTGERVSHVEQLQAWMRRALALATAVHGTTSPNPAVGCLVIAPDGGGFAGEVFEGATQPPGGPHAEIVALTQAGTRARGATLVTTLEPCAHTGRTGPCTQAIIAAGVAHVVVAVTDPDHQVNGAGVAELQAAGIDVTTNILEEEVAHQLRHYIVHRRTGRPFVTLKMACTLDGKVAASDGTSQWITGIEARHDGHQLRADHDAILVGAGTVRLDNPALTVRHVRGRDPLRIVLGVAPAGSAVHPCVELSGPIPNVLLQLADRHVTSVLVEGGAQVASAFHEAGLVDEYVMYVAPALMGAVGATSVLSETTTATIDMLRRGRFASVEMLGADLKIVMRP